MVSVASFAFYFNFPQILPKDYSAGVLCSIMSSQQGRGRQDDANVAKYSESSAVSDTKAVVEGIKSYQVRFQGSDEQFGSESDWLPCSKIDGQHALLASQAGIAETQARLKRMQEMLRSRLDTGR